MRARDRWHHNGLTPTGCARVWSAGAGAVQGTVRSMHSLIGGGRDAVQRPEAARQTVSLWPDSGTLAANARQRRDSACALTRAVWSTGCWTTCGWMQPRGYCRVALQQAKACGAELTWHRRRSCPNGHSPGWSPMSRSISPYRDIAHALCRSRSRRSSHCSSRDCWAMNREMNGVMFASFIFVCSPCRDEVSE